jgi:tetratricopeptide (TPR) repeat protein
MDSVRPQPRFVATSCALAVVALLLAPLLVHAQCQAIADSASTPPPKAQTKPGQPEFFDEPQFTVAGITDATNLGGHGSNTIVRTKESLAKDLASLGAASPTQKSPKDSAGEVQQQGDPLETVRKYQRAAETDPTESNYFNWGAELLVHRADEPAIEVFSKGNRLFPQSSRMLVGLGVAWYSRGSYDQAAQRLCAASDLNPDDPNPYLFLGKIQSVETTQFKGLVERLARFVRLQPENAMANYYYAISLWKGRKGPEDAATLAQAQTLLEKAVRLDPKLGIAYLQLGIVDSDRKDFPAAIADYQKAIQASPGLEEAHYRLAQVYRRTGERAKAEQELQVYDELSKKAAEEIERERHEVGQFVYTLRETPSTSQSR